MPSTYTFTCGATTLYWDGTNINYNPLDTQLGYDVTTEANANFTHRTINIVFQYNTDVFFYNFKPNFILPAGAMLYRQTLPGQWEQVTSSNLAANFSNGQVIEYCVYAQDNRYYNYYNIQLLAAPKTKQFNINFVFQNGAANTLPVSAKLKALSVDSNNNTIVFGGITVFSNPSTQYPLNLLPAGTYVFDVDVPDGYVATITADNSPTANDVTENGKLIGGNWKMVTAMNNTPQTFGITVYINPIPGYTLPWGLTRQSRG